MTQPTRPPDRQFARDVAREIDRRRVRRRMTLWTALLALVAAASAYLRCGGGFGLGGEGGLGGGGSSGEHRPAAGVVRCAIRVSAGGYSMAGKKVSLDDAVAACKSAAVADVQVTGDARHGDRQALVSALKAAGIEPAIHEPAPPARAPSTTSDGAAGSAGR